MAARALYEEGHAGGDYVLTGPESLSQADQVGVIGTVLGRRIRFHELSPEEFRQETEGLWPGPVVEMLLECLACDDRTPGVCDIHRGRRSSDRRRARFVSGPPTTPTRFGDAPTSHEVCETRIDASPLARTRFPI